jgi:signal transduction histidine kinase
LRYFGLPHRLLLRLPYRWQLGLVIFAFLLSTLLFALGFPGQLNGSLLGIPLALAVWLFRRRGIQIGLISTLALIFLVNTLTLHSLIWPISIVVIYLSGSLALIIEALVIYLLRHALDVSEAARVKSQLAEQQLELAYEREKQLRELKEQLLLNVSHELRTPLTGLLGYLELLIDFEDQLDADSCKTFLKNAFRQGEELQVLVNMILETLTIKHKEVPLARETVCVFTAVRDVLEEFDPREREAHPVTLDIPETLTVEANPQVLHQVLRNLLSNAFKYTPPPGAIDVCASRTCSNEQKEELILISVQDAGPGIPPEERSHLFGEFVRLKRDISGTIRGTGLGLYLSKQLVEDMGGTIWVESSGVADKGSRFCFTLPASAHKEQQ